METNYSYTWCFHYMICNIGIIFYCINLCFQETSYTGNLVYYFNEKSIYMLVKKVFKYITLNSYRILQNDNTI